MSFLPHDVFVLANPVVEQAFDDEMVLLDLQRDLYFSLNDVGQVIWAQINAGSSLAVILKVLQDQFDTATHRLEDDTHAFLEQLLEAGLILHHPSTAQR